MKRVSYFLCIRFVLCKFSLPWRLVKNQVAQLDSELSRLSLQLIERESELHAKTAHCQQLELKLAKYKQDIKQMVDDYGNRMKMWQVESSRQEAAILDYAEKLRKVQVCMTTFINLIFSKQRINRF